MREIYLKEIDYQSNGISPRTWLGVKTLLLVSSTLNCEDKLMFDLSTRYPKIQITIVNVGPKRHYRLHSEKDVEKTGRTHNLKAEDILRKNFPTHLESRIDETREDRQKLFKFVSLDQFLEEEDWKDWFDPKEMEEWRVAMGQMDSGQVGRE
ncbi:hypothetical protein V866_007505 [Kwoniella sp. B9012]|uniref:Uncharacterized protein n=1 Tax=Kwoniella europaea PYCC6329 TaxID=1423913 RepID=A0AAX4KQQ6_9TREE